MNVSEEDDVESKRKKCKPSMDNVAPEEWQVASSIPDGEFDTANEAKLALKVWAVSNGFSLVVKNSYERGVTLQCSQGGSKRSHKAGGWVPQDPLRVLRTEKAGCKYEVKIRCAAASGSCWTASATCSIHSGHLKLTADTIGSIPSARKLLSSVQNLAPPIEVAYASGASTSSIWNNLRQKHSWIALKDVENVINSMKKRQLNGMTEIEALHAKLKDESVVSGSVRDPNNRLLHLWFAPKASRALTLCYPDVLLMDCTYKTNKHILPLLHIVGVTGTSDSFAVACCFLADETMESYLWAIQVIERCLSKTPSVVVIDNGTALITAIQSAWPRCRVHLCTWHISKNIVTNCKTIGMSSAAFDAILRGWHGLVYRSTTEEGFLRGWVDLKSELLPATTMSTTGRSDAPLPAWLNPVDQFTVQCLEKAFEYIETNKLPIRDRFAGYAVNKFMHFKHTATSRAEGAHWANLKVRLKQSRGTLLDVYDRISRSTENRMNNINDKLNRERVEILTLPVAVFGPVIRGITHFALKYVRKQYVKAVHTIEFDCNNYSQNVLGLPCAHVIQERIRQGECLQMTDFHTHWYKDRINIDPDVIGVLDPLRVERTRGRPAHSRTTKRDPSRFEIVGDLLKKSRKCGVCGMSGHNKRSCNRATENVDE